MQSQQGEVTINLNLRITVDNSNNVSVEAEANAGIQQQLHKEKTTKEHQEVPHEVFNDTETIPDFGKSAKTQSGWMGD